MKNAITLLMFALIVGGTSAGVSFYLKPKPKPIEQHVDEEGAVATHVEPKDVAPSAEPKAAPADAHGHADSHGHATAAAPTPKEPAPDMGVVARPRAMSVEEILRYGMGLKKREEFMKQREATVSQQEAQMKLIQGDIQGEQREIEGLRTQVKEQLALADKRVVELQQVHQKIVDERAKAEAEAQKTPMPGAEVNDSQRDNLKRMSAIFQSMEPTKAANFLKDLANDGKLDMAVELLANFEEREAAKVLSAFNEEDKALVTDITEAFKNYKRPEAKKKK
jgi:hypothetical protein